MKDANTTINELTLIDDRIAQLESDLETLRRARILITDSRLIQTSARRVSSRQIAAHRPRTAPRKKSKLTIAEASTLILKQHPQLHVRALLERLAETYRIRTSEKNLNKTLNKWAQRQKFFKRVGPSTFASIEKKTK